MKSFKRSLMSTTLLPALVGAGIAVGGGLSLSTPSQAAGIGDLLPVAKARGATQLAA